MKRIVVYQSATGFTEKYAKWIAEELQCNCVAIKDVKETQLKEQDQVIYGGWIMGNMIVGLDKIRAIKKPEAVFGVGCTPHYEEVMEAIRLQNKLSENEFFYMVGGLKYDELSLPKKLILKTLKKATMKKEDRTRQEEYMAEALCTTFDKAEKKQIASLVDRIRNVRE